MAFSNFLQQCYLQDIIDGTILRFQLMPEEITEIKDAAWQDQEISGRPFPIKGYAMSNAGNITLQLQFFDDLGLEGIERVNIKNIIRWIRSLPYPDFQAGWISPPHPVRLIVGDFIKFTGVVLNVQITHRGPWDVENQKPRYIDASISLSEIGDAAQEADLYAIRGTDRLPFGTTGNITTLGNVGGDG